MPVWDERIEAHPAKQSLDEVSALLERITGDEEALVSGEYLPYAQRLSHAVSWVREALAAVDPELVPTAILDAMAAPSQNIAAELNAFASDRNEGRFGTADGYVDQLLAASASLRVIGAGAEAVADVQQAVTAFRRSAGQLLRSIEEQGRDAETQLGELSGRLAAQADEISQQRARLDNVIAQYQEQFSGAEAQRAATFQQSSTDARANLDAIANEGRTSLASIVSEGQEAVARIDSATQSAVQSASERAQEELGAKLTEATETATAVLEKIKELQEEAVRAVQVIGNTGLTGDYQRIANAEADSAGRWRLTAIVSFVLAAIGNAVVLGFELHQHVSLPTLIAARVSISVPLLALAAYAIAESHEHRKEERANRSFELQLASIGPFLAQFPEADQRKIRERVFDRFFPGRRRDDLPELPAGPEVPLEG